MKNTNQTLTMQLLLEIRLEDENLGFEGPYFYPYYVLYLKINQ